MVQIFNTILEQVLDSSGNPIVGAKLFIYEAGTTTKLTTFSDSALTSANANPLIADSAGRFVTIYGNPDDYKFVLAPANDTDPPASAIHTNDDYTIAATTSFSGGINNNGETEHLINAQTGTSYTILDGDRAKLVTHSNASAIAVIIPKANSSTFESGWYYETFNKGVGAVTITPTTSTINGLATYTIPTNQGLRITSDGTNYQVSAIGGVNPGVNAQTGTSYTIASDDLNKLVTTSNASAIAVTLPQANSTTFKSGWKTTLSNIGVGTATLTPTTSTIDGAATLVLRSGDSALITSDGTNYRSSFSVSGAMVLLETQTASASATIDFTTGIDSTYSHYKMVLIDVISANDTVGLYFRISQSSTFLSGSTDYQYANDFYRSDGAGTGAGSTGAAQILLNAGSLGTGTDESLNGEITFFNPAGTAERKRLISDLVALTEAPVFQAMKAIGEFKLNTTAVDGFRFLMSSGNIASGVFKLYGIT